MHHLSPLFRRKGHITVRSEGCQDQVRFFALLRIKPHAPPLVRVPVNSFEFHSCERTPQVDYLLRLLRYRTSRHPTPSSHRLRRGLPGYLILFAPHAFEPQRQLPSSKPPSPLCSSQYLRISPLHWEFRLPLRHSRYTVSKAVPGLSPGLSLQTCTSVYALLYTQ